MKRLIFSILMMAQFSVTVFAGEAAYPSRPVRVVVPFGPGGPTDVFARLIGQKLSNKLGQQFYVENQAGAGGNLGMGAVARAKPDGYTLLVVSSSFLVNPSLYSKAPYDARRDFAPITLAATTPNILTVHASVPASNVAELVSYVRSNPGKLSFATSGIGTTPHLSAELFKSTLSLDLVHVPFNGSGPAVQSVVGGHTPIAFTVMTPAAPQIRDGALRGLAVTTTRRSPALPEIPTLTEQGFAEQGSDTIQGFLAPAGTPPAVIDLLQREIVTAMGEADVKERMAQLGFEAVGSTPDEFRARIDTEIPRWSKVIKDGNIRIE